MTNLQSLREKYGESAIKHEPDPECKYCKGEGERLVKSLNQWTFCACVFFKKEDMFLAGMLSEFATKELKRLRGEENDSRS